MLPRDAEDNICMSEKGVLRLQIKPKLLVLCSAKEQLSSINAAVAPATGLIHEQQPRGNVWRLGVTRNPPYRAFHTSSDSHHWRRDQGGEESQKRQRKVHWKSTKCNGEPPQTF
jgi:hypothetical protein